MSKISNEIDKLLEIKKKEKIIELDDIEKHIGISKEFFNKLLIFHSNIELNDTKIASLLGINPFFIKEYKTASTNYDLKQVVRIISILRDYDMFSKGVGVKKADSSLLKEMVVKIININ